MIKGKLREQMNVLKAKEAKYSTEQPKKIDKPVVKDKVIKLPSPLPKRVDVRRNSTTVKCSSCARKLNAKRGN